MYEIFNIIIHPEVLLSIVVLSLVFYGIYSPLLKWSAGILLVIGVITMSLLDAWGILIGSNGLLMVNS